MLGSLLKSTVGVVTDIATVVTAPVAIAVDVTRVATKPIADAAREVTKEVHDELEDRNDV